MRIFAGLLIGVCALAGLSTPVRANNTFGVATISGINTNFSASNVGTNGEAGEPVPPFPAGNTLQTMWYSWTAPGNGTVTFETCGYPQTTFDTILASYTGASVGALTLITQNDDAAACPISGGNIWSSRITWDVVSGTVYRIQLDGYNAATGTFRLAYNFTGFTVNKTVSAATISVPVT